MLVGLLLVIVGIAIIVSNPILGLIPGLLLVVVGIVVSVLGFLGRSIGAILRMGRRDR
jgi:hypothetical protein